MVRSCLDEATGIPTEPPRAVIAPHAGYIYSGAVAGHAFEAARCRRGEIDRVVLIGPSHFVPVEGLTVSSHDAYRTPLGTIDVDAAAVGDLLERGLVVESDHAHRREHSLETHLPFVQEVFGEGVEIVPVVTGSGAGRDVARLLEAVAAGGETFVSVSSDLSHYLDYESAREVDAETRDAIEQLDSDAIEDRGACGHTAIRGLLRAADERGLEVETLTMCNSGDTAGDRSEVVGYGAWSFHRGR